jgi:hypothetical protein
MLTMMTTLTTRSTDVNTNTAGAASTSMMDCGNDSGSGNLRGSASLAAADKAEQQAQQHQYDKYWGVITTATTVPFEMEEHEPEHLIHSVRKGSATFATSGTTCPPPLPAVVKRGEWLQVQYYSFDR